MRVMVMLLACVFAVTLCGASGCEEKLAEKYGIKIKEDPPGSGHFVVIEDPAHGQIGQAVEVVKDGTSGSPLAPVGAAIGIASGWLYGILKARAQARADALNAQQATTIDEHENTQAATAVGLQTAVNAMLPDQAKILIQHLDLAHDALDVHAEHQDALQPVLKA